MSAASDTDLMGTSSSIGGRAFHSASEEWAIALVMMKPPRSTTQKMVLFVFQNHHQRAVRAHEQMFVRTDI